MKLSRRELKKLIMLEIQKSIEEETLLSKDDYLNYGMLSRHSDPGRERLHKSCNQCGYQMSEGEKVCEQCGYSVYEAEEIKKILKYGKVLMLYVLSLEVKMKMVH